jgi:uncharacterized membrane protein required for colicin V production
LYEEEKTEIEKHLILEQLKPYEPGFLSKLWGSIQEGARGLESLILGIVSLWAWILAAWLSYKAYKHFRRNLAHM